MKTRLWDSMAVASGLLLVAMVCLGLSDRAVAGEASKAKIVLVAGPCEHPPGTHEAAAGARLLKHCVENAANVQAVSAEVFYEWPKDAKALDDAATIVFIGDIFPPERMDEPAKIKAQLAGMMDRGCGIVCLHYATGLRAQHVTADGDHPLLHWLGGYFSSGCPHHQSTARVCPATLVPETVDHPVSRGWQKFSLDDEPYWNIYFGKDGPGKSVTPLVSSMLPPEKPEKQIIGWAVEREDGGRGVGIVLPHFLRSWQVDELRTLVLNAVCWTAKLDIPPEGVKSPLPDLATFQPKAVAP